MRDVGSTLLFAIVALALVRVAVPRGEVATVLVPPPEAVAESFARHVAAKRYDPAMKYVDWRSDITRDTVREVSQRLRDRAGRVNQVDAEAGPINRDETTARAILETERAGRVTYEFKLVRSHYHWKILEWQR
jgi:hypothetical protein